MKKDRIRNTKEKDEERFVCQFPECIKTYVKQPGKPDACPAHRQLIADVVYILGHLKSPNEVPGAPGDSPSILVPRPGMEDKAIQEALKRRGNIR